MALSKYTVRCIKMLSSDALADALNDIVAASYTAEEITVLVHLSGDARAWGL